MRVPGRGAEDFLKIFLYHPSRELTHSYIRVLHFTVDRLRNRHSCCPKYIPFSRNIGSQTTIIGGPGFFNKKAQKNIFSVFLFFFYLETSYEGDLFFSNTTSKAIPKKCTKCINYACSQYLDKTRIPPPGPTYCKLSFFFPTHLSLR